jgi:hypothetical protein
MAYLHFAVAGFELQEMQARMKFGVTIVDKQKRPLSSPVEVPVEHKATGTDAMTGGYQGVYVHREGAYLLRLVVEDLNSKRQAEHYVPITVIDPESTATTAIAERETGKAERR